MYVSLQVNECEVNVSAMLENPESQLSAGFKYLCIVLLFLACEPKTILSSKNA